MPRRFSPCGTALDRQATLLMRDPVRFYSYTARLRQPVREALLVPFSRGEKPGGLGIGLSLARSLVALHRGSVHAESPGRGKGCTFVVRLPLAK